MLIVFRLLDQLKADKTEIRSSYDKIKEELNQVVENEDREKEKLKHKINELEILLDNERQKNGSLYDVKRFLENI